MLRADQVIEWRHRNGWNKTEAAEAIGVTRTTYRSMEEGGAGKTQALAMETAERHAARTRFTPRDIDHALISTSYYPEYDPIICFMNELESWNKEKLDQMRTELVEGNDTPTLTTVILEGVLNLHRSQGGFAGKKHGQFFAIIEWLEIHREEIVSGIMSHKSYQDED